MKTLRTEYQELQDKIQNTYNNLLAIGDYSFIEINKIELY